MADQAARTYKIVEWFRKYVRSILGRIDPPAVVEGFDHQASHLEYLEKNKMELFPICLLGQAGVGKSTLVNTLIADTEIVVPSGGGTGPLTANALRVIYGESKSFKVEYHAKKQINETRFIIEAEIARQSKNESAVLEANEPEEAELPEIGLDSEEQKNSRTSEAIGRASLLVAGNQSAKRELTYLADALRWLMDQKWKFQSELLEEDMERLRQARTAIDYGTRGEPRHFDIADNADFGQRLRDHACGSLAPLIKDMTIHWPSPLLRDSLELIDLPGIGILSDAYASVTSDYLRNRAKAVMLVVDSRGIRREDAELLKTSGFLNRLLHASNDLSADPVTLIIAVVKIDDVAVENWRNDRQLNGGKAQKTREEHFADQVRDCRSSIAHRLQGFLQEIWDVDTEGKRIVVQSIMDNLQIFPVSAPQYRLHLSDDPDDDKPFLPDEASTKILELRGAISCIAKNCLAEQQRRLEESRDRFFGQLRARLGVLNAQRGEVHQAAEEVERFKGTLRTFTAPLQREFDTRRGGFRNFLRSTIPTKIEAKVESASTKAQKAIHGDLIGLQDAHWKTLQAAVRKEGTFYGSRHINLPNDFALRFEEPVAEVWSREILKDVRNGTREFADFEKNVVNRVLDWAAGQEVKVSTDLLEALLEAVNQRRQQVNAVGKEAVDELRSKVRTELIKKIENPIRRKCKQFVDNGENQGRGVKGRILELFRQLAEDVVEAAAVPATVLLKGNFGEVEKEISAAFGEHKDPVAEAVESLIQSKEQGNSKEDAELVKALETALAEMTSLEERTP